MGVLDFVNTGLQAGAQIINQINQKRVWEREDNAVQRRVADLRKAGLSPTLAAGSAAGVSQPIRVEAPVFRRDVAAQSAGIAQTRAQTELTSLQSAIKELEGTLAQNVLNVLRRDASDEGTMSLGLANSTIARMIAENKNVARDSLLAEEYGMPATGASTWDLIARDKLFKKLFPGMNTGSYAGTDMLLRLIFGMYSQAK